MSENETLLKQKEGSLCWLLSTKALLSLSFSFLPHSTSYSGSLCFHWWQRLPHSKRMEILRPNLSKNAVSNAK